MIKSSLRRQLVLPFVSMVAIVALAIGWVSFQATAEAVGALMQRVLLDMVGRVGGVTGNHLVEARTVLEAVVPESHGGALPPPFVASPATLEDQFWSLSVSGQPEASGRAVYFGGADGSFVGIDRTVPDRVELYLRQPGELQRRVYLIDAPGDRERLLRSDDYDPRQRPWYRAALAQPQAKPVWAPVYHDFSNARSTLTLARAVYRADRQLAGAVATDLPLAALTAALRRLKLSEHGVLFLLDADGRLVVSSSADEPFRPVEAPPRQARVGGLQTELIGAAGARAKAWKAANIDMRLPRHEQFELRGEAMEMAAARLDPKYGLDWSIVVAAPRADFMGGVTRSLYNGLLIAAVCILVALLFGLAILNRVLADIRQLTDAAHKVGAGEPLPKLEIERSDELGQLAQTFFEMERNLRTDRLTGVATREWLLQQVATLQRRGRRRFALLFVDLDNFKFINDHYGHDAGDQVLASVAARMKMAVRSSDVVARYGGDEFAVLLKDTGSMREIFAVERKLAALVEQPVELDSGGETIGVSIGWAMFPHDGDTVEKLLKVADLRMFASKKERKSVRDGSTEVVFEG